MTRARKPVSSQEKVKLDTPTSREPFEGRTSAVPLLVDVEKELFDCVELDFLKIYPAD